MKRQAASPQMLAPELVDVKNCTQVQGTRNKGRFQSNSHPVQPFRHAELGSRAGTIVQR